MDIIQFIANGLLRRELRFLTVREAVFGLAYRQITYTRIATAIFPEWPFTAKAFKETY